MTVHRLSLIQSVSGMGRALAIGLFALLFTTVGYAQEGPDALGIQMHTQTQMGGKKPALVLNPSYAVKRLKIVMKGALKGRTVRLKSGAIRPGGQKVLSWKQSVGMERWNATFTVQYHGGNADTFQLEFSSTVYPKISSKISKDMVHLDEQMLEVRLNQPAKKVEIQVIGDDGKMMYSGVEEYEDMEANTPLQVHWEQKAGIRVLKINLRVWSVFGFWIGTEITPFEVDIPHEDVEFEFGKSHIPTGEIPKVQHTLSLLREKLKRYGGLVQLQLYIAGYTDSVGSRSANQALSEGRARSIAQYFRTNGVRIPIFFQGFGEDAQAVPTPDETKERRNRRAVYVLSASAPAKQAAIPRSQWKRIP